MTKKHKIPENEIIPFKCSDKDWQEEWYQGRNLMNIPHSFRMVLTGLPSSGKSCTIKNIIYRANPQFEVVQVYSYDPQGSSEWNSIGAQIMTEIPDPRGYDGETKTLLIFDDFDPSKLTKKESGDLSMIFKYTSSHKNLSVCMAVQNPFSCPVDVRRICNVFVLYKQPDLSAMATLASRTGLRKKELLSIFDKHIGNIHDFLMIDITLNTPAHLRINGYRILNKDEY